MTYLWEFFMLLSIRKKLPVASSYGE